jgi:hypothetical protein
MEVDSLTKEQRIDHMRRGLCFECHLPGHTANAHKKKKNYQFKQNAKVFNKDAYGKIRMILADLDKEDKEEILKMMEEQGF